MVNKNFWSESNLKFYAVLEPSAFGLTISSLLSVS